MSSAYYILLALLAGIPTFGSVFAQAPQVIRVGDPILRGSSLPLGVDTVDEYIISNGERRATAISIRSIAFQADSIEPSYAIRTLLCDTQGDTTVTTMVVRAQDLSLVFHRVKASHDSAAVTATRTHLTAWVVLPNQPMLLFDQTIEHPVFGVEGQVPWLFPLLPLTGGYTAVIPHFSQWNGNERWDTVTVVGSERITVGARTYDCWKVDTGPLGPPTYRMIRWIDKRTRRVIQSVLRGARAGPEYWSYLRS